MRKLSIFLIVMLMAIFVVSVCAQEMGKKAEGDKEKNEKVMKMEVVKKVKAEQENEGEENEEGEEDDDDDKDEIRDVIKIVKVGDGGEGMICPICKRKMGDNKMPMFNIQIPPNNPMQNNPMQNNPMQMDMMKMMGDKEMMGNPDKPDLIGMKMGMVKSIMGHAEEIKLTEEQRGKIESIIVANRKDMVRKNADREIAEIDLGELLKKDDPDTNAVKAQIQKMSDIESDIKFTQIKVGIDARAVLTDEQKVTLKKLQAQDERGPKMAVKKLEGERPGPKEMQEHPKGKPGKPMPGMEMR